MGGSKSTENGTEPIDMTVSMNIDLKEYPKIKAKPLQHDEEEAVVSKASVQAVKFSTTRDKFL